MPHGRRLVATLAWQSSTWDSHEIEKNHRRLAWNSDQAIGALLTDLKERGL